MQGKEKTNVLDILQDTSYFKLLKEAYENPENTSFRPYRSHQILLEDLNSINQFNPKHARHYVKRINTQQTQYKDCEAVFTEIIVYSYYLRLFYEGVIQSIDRKEDDYDLRIGIKDGTSQFLEVFSVMPDIKIWTIEELAKGEAKANSLQTQFIAVQDKLKKVFCIG